MFGHTAARASCGLFQPATYRVVSLALEHSMCTLGWRPTRLEALHLPAIHRVVTAASGLGSRAASGRAAELAPAQGPPCCTCRSATSLLAMGGSRWSSS